MKNIDLYHTLERAKHDLKLGVPVVVEAGDAKHLIVAVENISEQVFSLYKYIGYEVVIPASRSKALYNVAAQHSLRVKLNLDDLHELKDMVLHNNSSLLAYSRQGGPDYDRSIIQFVKSAELMPCVIISQIDTDEAVDWCRKNNIVNIKMSDITSARDIEVAEICRTPLILANSNDTEIVVYRSYAKTHYAIIIGDGLSMSEPIVRVHSSCYTGDLLDSLTCDCGGQLKSTIKLMSESGGGVIIYLSQEGRGIGLTNKLRAYSEQILNKRDTVDANTALGFDGDERDFGIAVQILKKLRIDNIRLITNNLNKILQLRENSVNVTSHIASKVEYNKYNIGYLHTKFNKLGHIVNY